MKKILVATLSLCLAGLVGCSTTRQERSVKASKSMAELNALLTQGFKQTETLQDSLNALAKAKPDDLRKAYDAFAKNADKLRSIADDARSQAKSMKKNSDAYFSVWEKELNEISNNQLKKMSKERQALLQSEYREIAAAMTGLGAAYKAYEQDLSDIEKFLGNDLTSVGGDLAKPYLTKLANESDAVLRSTKKAQSAIVHLEAVLKPK